MNQAEGHPHPLDCEAIRGFAPARFRTQIRKEGWGSGGREGRAAPGQEDAGEARPIGRAQPGLDLSHKHFRTRKRKNEDSCGFRRACVIPNAQLELEVTEVR